jgi:hypothetical protein
MRCGACRTPTVGCSISLACVALAGSAAPSASQTRRTASISASSQVMPSPAPTDVSAPPALLLSAPLLLCSLAAPSLTSLTSTPLAAALAAAA